MTDPDFLRLMQGEVKLADLTPERQKEFARQVKAKELDLSVIKDESLRKMYERWVTFI